MRELLFATGEHLLIVALSMIVATLVGVGLGILSSWKKRLGTVIITIAEIVQTIPSLALLALLMIIFGLGNLTMGIALVLYALLPIIRNTQVALTELPPPSSMRPGDGDEPKPTPQGGIPSPSR